MKGGTFLKIMAVLIFLALVANLVVSVKTGNSPMTPTVLRVIAFGALAVGNLFMAGAGIYFTARAHQKHEKASIEWGRRGFVVNAVVASLFTLAPWFFYTDDIELLDAMFNSSLVLLLFGLSNGAFLVSFYREYLRNVGARPKGSRPRRHTPVLPDEGPGRGAG